MERSKRNLILAVAAIAVAAGALVLVIALSGDDEGGAPVSTQPSATSTTETGEKPSKRGKKGSRGSSEKGPATGTQNEREREPIRSIRQRVAGGGVETIRVQNGVPVDGLLRLIYDRGDRVKLRIVSNRAERFFIPILGLTERASADEGAEFDFTATRSGLYGVELRRDKTRTRVAVLAIH